MKKITLAALLLITSVVSASAQTFCSQLIFGAVLTAAQWQNCFAQKQDLLGFTPLNRAGDTMLGRLNFAPSTADSAGLRVQPGVAPTSPQNGDVWTTASGLYWHVNNATVSVPGTNVANTWTALQSFSDGDLALLGSSSGSLRLHAASAAGTSSITFPAGTTDFSATGGTSNFVRQNSAGGPLSVVRPAASDLSNGVTGSGSVVLATSPTLTTPNVGVATATSVNKVAITAPASGSTLTIADGTTLTVTSSTSIGVGQYLGTGTNDAATVGNLGEYVSSSVALGSAVSLATGTTSNVTSISLTAGDWDAGGNVVFTGGATTTVTDVIGAVTTASGGMPTSNNGGIFSMFVGGATPYATTTLIGSTGLVRLSLSGTTTVYLVAKSTFGTSTANAYGIIQARRVR